MKQVVCLGKDQNRDWFKAQRILKHVCSPVHFAQCRVIAYKNLITYHKLGMAYCHTGVRFPSGTRQFFLGPTLVKCWLFSRYLSSFMNCIRFISFLIILFPTVTSSYPYFVLVQWAYILTIAESWELPFTSKTVVPNNILWRTESQ